MKILLAQSNEDITRCYHVMVELRLHVSESEFINFVKRQADIGYKLVYLVNQDTVVAVAGFRMGESLAWGKYVYVDDLITLSSYRSQGFGKALLNWLREYAVKHGCGQLHLDSGVQRKDAHRFYQREGMKMASFHFVEII